MLAAVRSDRVAARCSVSVIEAGKVAPTSKCIKKEGHSDYFSPKKGRKPGSGKHVRLSRNLDERLDDRPAKPEGADIGHREGRGRFRDREDIGKSKIPPPLSENAADADRLARWRTEYACGRGGRPIRNPNAYFRAVSSAVLSDRPTRLDERPVGTLPTTGSRYTGSSAGKVAAWCAPPPPPPPPDRPTGGKLTYFPEDGILTRMNDNDLKVIKETLITIETYRGQVEGFLKSLAEVVGEAMPGGYPLPTARLALTDIKTGLEDIKKLLP